MHKVLFFLPKCEHLQINHPARKSSWFFCEHPALLFLSFVLHRTSQHRENNLLWMIRKTFFFLLLFKQQYTEIECCLYTELLFSIYNQGVTQLIISGKKTKISVNNQSLWLSLGLLKAKAFDLLRREKEIRSWILDFLFCTWSSQKPSKIEKSKVTPSVLVAPNSQSLHQFS